MYSAKSVSEKLHRAETKFEVISQNSGREINLSTSTDHGIEAWPMETHVKERSFSAKLVVSHLYLVSTSSLRLPVDSSTHWVTRSRR
jgi:hypothetical protein